MSDEEEEVEEEEEEEEEEVEEEEEEEEENEEDADNDEEEDEKQKELKQKSVQEDIATIRDIFQYIDRTSSRMIRSKQFNDGAQGYPGNRGNQQYGSSNSNMNHNGNPPVAWSNYENLTDVERAELLERAVAVLAGDDMR